MKTRLKIICFLFILFFPGKAYSDSSWWNYFDYAGVTWNIEEFKTRADGHNSISNFTPGFYSATSNDGVDVHTDTSFDIFLGKKFGRTKGEINYSKNNLIANKMPVTVTIFLIQECPFKIVSLTPISPPMEFPIPRTIPKSQFT